MKNMLEKSEKNAFTLVELIITITILVILATIGFISYSNYTSLAEDIVRKQNLDTIEKAITFSLSKGERLIEPDNPTPLLIKFLDTGNIEWIEGEIGEKSIKKYAISPNVLENYSEKIYKYYTSKDNEYFLIEIELKNGEKYFKTNANIKNLDKIDEKILNSDGTCEKGYYKWNGICKKPGLEYNSNSWDGLYFWGETNIILECGDKKYHITKSGSFSACYGGKIIGKTQGIGHIESGNSGKSSIKLNNNIDIETVSTEYGNLKNINNKNLKNLFIDYSYLNYGYYDKDKLTEIINNLNLKTLGIRIYAGTFREYILPSFENTNIDTFLFSTYEGNLIFNGLNIKNIENLYLAGYTDHGSSFTLKGYFPYIKNLIISPRGASVNISGSFPNLERISLGTYKGNINLSSDFNAPNLKLIEQKTSGINIPEKFQNKVIQKFNNSKNFDYKEYYKEIFGSTPFGNNIDGYEIIND